MRGAILCILGIIICLCSSFLASWNESRATENYGYAMENYYDVLLGQVSQEQAHINAEKIENTVWEINDTIIKTYILIGIGLGLSLSGLFSTICKAKGWFE